MLWEPSFHAALGVRPVVSSDLPALASPVQALDAANAALFFQDAAGTQAAANGSGVGRANDANAGAWFFRQQVAGERPVYVTGAVNGKPAIRFDGTTAWMALQNAATGFANAGERFRSTTFTCLLAYRPTGPAGADYAGGIFCAGNSEGGEGGNALDNVSFQKSSAGPTSLARHSGSQYRNLNLIGAGYTPGVLRKVVARGSPANGYELREKSSDGTFSATASVATTPDLYTWDFACLGCELGTRWGAMPSNRIPMDFCELRWWDSRASDAQMDQIMAYLDNKWGA